MPGPGIESVSLALAGGFFVTEPPGKPSITFLLNSLSSASPTEFVPLTPASQAFGLKTESYQ